MDNASDTKQIRAAKKLAAAEEAERKIVLANIMSSPAGRRYMHRRLADCHCFETPFTGKSSYTDFNLGMQSVGLRDLDELMRSTPEQFIQMLREANDRRNSSGPIRNQPNDGRNDSGSDDPAAGSVESEYEPGDDEDRIVDNLG